MNLEENFLTYLAIIGFIAALLYKIHFFRRKLGPFTLLHLTYLLVLPAVIFPIFFSYLQIVINNPPAQETVFGDTFLLSLILVSTLYTYGAVAIHAVSKLMSPLINPSNKKAKKLNNFFHLTFSHNLGLSGFIMSMVGIALLELNHPSMISPASMTELLLRGIGLGSVIVIAMLFYEPFKQDQYNSRWRDLRSTFVTLWIAIALLIIVAQAIQPTYREYQLLLPTIISLVILASLNGLIVLRTIGRKGWLGKYISKKAQ